jgi:hypothetical protein
MNPIITKIRKALEENTDEKILDSSHRYFKEGEEAKIYGVGMQS